MGRRDIHRIGSAIDDASLMLEEYGTVSVSSPLLAPASSTQPGDEFGPERFKLKKDADGYYRDARAEVQGRFARFDETSSITRLGLKANLDLEAGLAGVVSLQRFRAEEANYRERQAMKAQIAREQYELVRSPLPENPTAEQSAARKKVEGELAAKKKRLESMPGTDTPPVYPSEAVEQAKTTTPAATGTPDDTTAEAGDSTAEKPPADNAGSASESPAASAVDAFAEKQLKAFGGLLSAAGAPDVKLANRAAINIAAGDVASEYIFGLLSDPGSRIRFEDKKLLFGVSMVSVAPGWRTKENFAADVSLQAGFTYRPARSELLAALRDDPATQRDALLRQKIEEALELAGSSTTQNGEAGSGAVESKGLRTPLTIKSVGAPAGRAVYTAGRLDESRLRAWDLPARLQLPTNPPTPLVAAVSPMTDSEVVDAAASNRQQRVRSLELALSLAALGQKADAKLFREYAERLQDDAATRGAMNAVTAYSHSGSLFGFQIGPRLRADAIRRPGQQLTTLALDRQSFPVLVIIGMDAADLGVRFAYEGGLLVAYEPVLTFDQGFRWLPLSEKAVKDRSPFAAGWFAPDVEERRLEHAERLFQARNDLPLSPDRLAERLDGLFAAKAFARDLNGKTVGDVVTGDATTLRKCLTQLRTLRTLLTRDVPNLKIDRPIVDLEMALCGRVNAPANGSSTRPTVQSSSGGRQLSMNAILCELDKLIEKTYERPTSSEGDFVAFVRGRIDLFAYQAYGSSNEQVVPLELFRTMPTAKPAMDAGR